MTNLLLTKRFIVYICQYFENSNLLSEMPEGKHMKHLVSKIEYALYTFKRAKLMDSY